MHPTRLTWAALLFAAFAPANPSAVAQNPPANAPEDGLFLSVPNPITSEAVARLRSTTQAALNHPKRPVRKFVLDFNPGDKDAASAEYGPAYELAKHLRGLTLNNATAIAFVRGKVTRHSVLPALACSELVMGPDGKIGEVVEPNGPSLPRGETAYYLELAGPAREALALKMIDRNAEVLRGLRNGATFYLDGRRRDDPQFKDVQGIDPNPALPAGSVELYTAEQARRFGLCSLVKRDRAEVADAYRLTPAALQDDKLRDRPPVPWKIVITGTLDGSTRETISRRLDYATRRGANTIFLQLECSGGDPEEAAALADRIQHLEDAEGNPVRTVAFVPQGAPDLASFLAFACDDLVMARNAAEDKPATVADFDSLLRAGNDNKPVLPKRKGRPKADEDAPPAPDDDGRDNARRTVDYAKDTLRKLLQGKGVSPVLVDGLFDADLVLVRARSAKDVTKREIFTERQFQDANRDGQAWVFEGNVKERGKPLRLTAQVARDLGLAREVVANRDIAEVYPIYGLEASAVQEATPDWLDALANFLIRPEISVLLVMIGIGGLILELKVPGLTIAGVTAAFCFVLFFWSQSQMSGQISYLAILLFLLGLGLIAVEIFLLPGFGVMGIAGILSLLVGLGLATVDRVPQTGGEWTALGATMLQYCLSLVGAGIGTFFIARYLPNIPFANRLILPPPSAETAGEVAPLPGAEQAAALLGAIGMTTTMLRPAGIAKFDDAFVDIVSDGAFIPAGQRVQVIEVEGTRIVVKAV